MNVVKDERHRGKNFQTGLGEDTFGKIVYEESKYIDTDGFLSSQPQPRAKGFGSGDAHRVSEFTQDFKVKKHRETLMVRLLSSFNSPFI